MVHCTPRIIMMAEWNLILNYEMSDFDCRKKGITHVVVIAMRHSWKHAGEWRNHDLQPISWKCLSNWISNNSMPILLFRKKRPLLFLKDESSRFATNHKKGRKVPCCYWRAVSTFDITTLFPTISQKKGYGSKLKLCYCYSSLLLYIVSIWRTRRDLEKVEGTTVLLPPSDYSSSLWVCFLALGLDFFYSMLLYCYTPRLF